MHRWWLDRPVLAKGLIAVAIPLVALLATTTASLVLQHGEAQERQEGLAANALATSAGQVLLDAVNAETGMRGYVATGNPLFLQPYHLTLSRFGGEVAAMRSDAAAVGVRRSGQAVEATTARVMAELAAMRAAVARGTPAGTLQPQLEADKRSMDLLRGQIAALAAGPRAVVAQHRAAITRMETDITALNIVALALGVLAGVTGVALFATGISRRLTATSDNAGRLGQGLPLVPLIPARDELGRLADALVSAQELLAARSAELITARDEAVRATQAKNAFLSSTSHELRTPLNAVLGFTQLLQMSDLNAEDQDAVERILGAGRHLLELINELIDIARIESVEFSVSVEPVLVAPVAEETCQLMAPLAAARSITLTQDTRHHGLAVRADRHRLHEILVNLISNAIKYNRDGGTITLICQPGAEGRATLTVADTGPGIAAADLERIFVAFERLGAEQGGIEGTGIGLPLARAFAEAMAGKLTAASVLGQGATFTLTLPRCPDMAAVPPVPAQPSAAGAAAGTAETRLRVLYIEDNPANIEVVTRFARSRPGIVLQPAATGPEGLDLAIREIPDLILLDLHLPGMSGGEVLQRLWARPATAGIPVAVLSAEASPDVIRQMQARGIVAYLTKPLELADLGRLLDTMIAASHPDVSHPDVSHPHVSHPDVSHPAVGHPAVGHPAAGHPDGAPAAPARGTPG